MFIFLLVTNILPNFFLAITIIMVHTKFKEKITQTKQNTDIINHFNVEEVVSKLRIKVNQIVNRISVIRY